MTGQVWPAGRCLTRPCSANPLSSVLGKRGHGRKGLALEPFEEGAACGRNIGEVLTDTGGIERSDSVAATGNGHKPAIADEMRGLAHQLIGAVAEGLELEGADRTVPYESLHLGKPALEIGHGFRPDIEDHLVFRNVADLADLPLGSSLQLLGHDKVLRQHHVAAMLFRARHDLLDHRDRVGLAERLADLYAL